VIISGRHQETVLNWWNACGPLKHVIVGRADGTMVQAPEPAIERDWPDHGFPLGTYGPLSTEMEEKANEQVDDFAKLVLDPKTVCVEASETTQMEQLDKLGFEVIPVPLWDVAVFAGGLHCATADVYREGTCEDYFPKQVEGY